MAAFSSMGRIPAAPCDEELEEADEEPVALKYWLRSCIGKNHSGWRIFFATHIAISIILFGRKTIIHV